MSDLSYLIPIPPSLGTPPLSDTNSSITLKGHNLLLWRVREWSVAATINGSRDDPLAPSDPDYVPNLGPAVGIIGGDPFGAIRDIPTDELDLILSDWGGFGYGIYTNWPNPNSYVYTTGPSIPMSALAGGVDVGLEVGTKSSLELDLVQGFFYLRPPPFSGTSPIVKIPLVFENPTDPATFRITCGASGSFVPSPHYTASWDLAAIMTPTLWWGYDGRFDTATGLPL